MKPESQRIAIAEACPSAVEWHDGIPYWKGSWSGVGEGNEHFAEFHPLNDLNALHEAEKTLTKAQWWSYISELVEITGAEWTDAYEEVFVVAHATAAQRSEALLRAIGKWDDSL